MSHAKLPASGSSRWLGCPASIKACEPYENTTSSASAYGTAAHALAERCLTDFSLPSKYHGIEIEGVMVDTEMVEGVEEYIDYVNQLDMFFDMTLIEERVDFSHIVPEGFGTADLVLINSDELHVVDLKFGRGIVHAENNSQLSLYALGALYAYGFMYEVKKIVLHIAQPRIGHFDRWETTPDELVAWSKWVSERANLALSANPPFEPSAKACQWCAHQANCSALAEHVNTVLTGDFDNPEALDGQVDKVSDEHIKRILDNMEMITSFLKAVEVVALERLQSGRVIPGYKIVESRKNKAWVDEEKASEALLKKLSKDDIYTQKLCTPTQALKLLGKIDTDLIDNLWSVPEGRPVLAPESDKRPSIGSVVDGFDNVK